MRQYERIKSIVAYMKEDLDKFNAGNMAAGKRLRSNLQDLKKTCNNMRDQIQVIRLSKKNDAQQKG